LLSLFSGGGGQASFSSHCTIMPNTLSMPRKNTERISIMMPTKIAVVVVSWRVGHTTLRASAFTWLKNSLGLVLAMAVMPSLPE